ncbi:MAG: T9SS type A sorting domain-containing protein [Bacteroidetes bacterium]|nr:T9SS type A sorting domain-containing protein [Bacteroidota bacterium]
MRLSIIKALIPVLILILPLYLFSQSSADYTVQLSAVVKTDSPRITLSWPQDLNSIGYQIFRKDKQASSWGFAIVTLPDSAISYADTSVNITEGYEYRVIKYTNSYTGYGYIYAGMELPPVEFRGRLILIVDSTHAVPLASELVRLESDLIGDGWEVSRFNVSPTDSVTVVKQIILNEHDMDSAVNAVFLFGHVPVPYSGNINPDAHADHIGAWPADVYYGDLDGSWTDALVNNTSAASTKNHNIPGDQKFDQSIIASDIELMVGRVDMYDMPAFSETEEQLLRQYLDKHHAFRHKMFDPVRRAIIDDNFGGFSGEAFGSNGWRNFAPMFGADSVSSMDYFTTLKNNSYLWSYGCGGGTDTSAGGIGKTADFASDTVQTVFTVLFGSYFGDWDTQNNFLRAPLASKTRALSNFWAGRPHWHVHHMALGGTLGYAARLTQNNSSLYTANYFARFIHVALMGDPSLRMHMVGPPGSLTADSVDANIHVLLNWTASNDSVKGYYVYRSGNSMGPFTRISNNIITDSNFIDSFPINGNNTYMVRAIKLEKSASGTYFNLSQGMRVSISLSWSSIDDAITKPPHFKVYPNPTTGLLYYEILLNENDPIVKLELYDVTGKLFLIKEFNSSTNKNIGHINLEGYPRGVYFLNLSTKTTILSKEFILQ